MNKALQQIHDDLIKVIRDLKLEVNGKYDHPLSDQLIGKDTVIDTIDLYFEQFNEEKGVE